MQSLKTANMVLEISKRFRISPSVEKAFLSINREIFVPNGFAHLAYTLDALPMGASQWISSPLTVAKMTEYLQCEGADSVLEIGCGSGYQAAILSRLIRRVFSIERIEKLLLEARARIKLCDIANINTKLDDGQNGWSAYAPYDRILLSASIREIPQSLIAQLSEGGILVAPLEINNAQVITRFVKRNGILSEKQELEHCIFVPVLNGLDKES
ncbi:MAG: protein-L-isoaspartate(D-aspartate) O-methyltransferase [Helicobacter sp.]|uniref:protein-L-isoaspartate(D-aspartate) O-methyltransferase n=1 Tax=Helicobacter sp. TaxID=218 RepID=UPI0023CF59DE|nr:protein-L-isoaspartate(D-aspartate) O-methyltransferase [Helicobacter sp.]MDE5925255.1 protein-L-isoaspartate(D-aspartate) O-methyltransferase [Helicobacter sp.]MDE7175454.1 protein-L-isoaspartate(D-aspartate) O-methyltransferase [Helicobacter sp.]